MGQQTSQPYFSGQQGLRALHVWENSPAANAGIIPFLDFIIGIKDMNGNEPEITSLKDFINLLQSNQNNDFQFLIFNILTQNQRTIQITLHKNWANANSVLGIIFRYEPYTKAYTNIMKVTNVEKDSPAYIAGLQSNDHFILGVQMMKLESQHQFQQIVKDYARMEQSFLIAVYNQAENCVSYLKIQPSNQWGGKGCLGCELSLGVLNQLNIQDLENKIKTIKYYQNDYQQLNFNSQVKQQTISNEEKQLEVQNNQKSEEKQQLEQITEKEPELLPKEINFKKQFYSEKAQVTHEITGDQLLDIQVDLSQYIQS